MHNCWLKDVSCPYSYVEYHKLKSTNKCFKNLEKISYKSEFPKEKHDSIQPEGADTICTRKNWNVYISLSSFTFGKSAFSCSFYKMELEEKTLKKILSKFFKIHFESLASYALKSHERLISTHCKLSTLKKPNFIAISIFYKQIWYR